MEKKERREAVKTFDLVKLAEMFDYTPIPVGRHYFTLKEHDSVRINIVKNTFVQYSTGKGGDPVSFLMTFGTGRSNKFKSLDYCLYWLEKKLNIENTFTLKELPKKEKLDLILPEKDVNNRRIFAYLNKTRCIDPEIIKLFLHRKILYQSQPYKNCVFVNYDKNGKPVFATERGSLPNKKYMHEIEGCDYDYGINFENEGADTLVINEAVIDMMSFMTLNMKNHLHEKYSFISICSVTKDKCIYNCLNNHKEIKDVIIALDHDEAGMKATQEIKNKINQTFKNIDILVVYPTAKDWNEELQNRTKEAEKENSLGNFAK